MIITVITNASPEASFTVSSSAVVIAEGDSSVQVDFDASASSDDGTIESWTWDFGDGTAGSGESISHSYTAAGVYYAELTVTDDNGAADTAGQSITVNSSSNNAPSADAGADQTVDADTDGTEITLSGSGIDGDGSISSYAWSFYSAPENSSLSDSDIADADAASASFDVASETGTPDQSAGYVYVLELQVTDDDGATAVDFVEITVTGAGSINVGIR